MEEGDFRLLFENMPGLYLVLSPDLLIMEASNAFLTATFTRREEILGKNIFELFPDNPDDPQATGVTSLRASLERVIKKGSADKMDVQKYDILQGRKFEAHYWRPLNIPVIKEGQLKYIICETEDVTPRVLLERSEEKYKDANQQLKQEIEERKAAEKKLKRGEKKIYSIFNNSIDALLLTSPDGQVYMANQATQEIFGYSEEELKAAGRDALADAHDPRLQQALAERRLTGKFRGELTFRRKDGSPVPVEVSSRIFKDEDGKEWMTVSVRDISRRAEAERKINWLASIVESSNDAIISKGLDGIIKTWNAGAERLFEYKAAEVIGRHISIIVPEELRPEEEQILAALNKGEEVKAFETRRISKSGKMLDVLLTISLIKDKSGKAIGAAKIAHDITELKRVQKEIDNLNNRLEEKVRLRTSELATSKKELENFSYTISHNLRIPIRAINGYTHILEEEVRGVLNDEDKDLLEKIKRNSKILGELVDSLTSFIRLGNKKVVKARTDINNLVRNIIDERRHNLPPRYEFKIGRLPEALCDQQLIREVFKDLIGNAVKFSSKKEKPVIEIGAWHQANEIVFYVKDNGIGFNMAYFSKLFNVFESVHAVGEFEGIGAGLAMVKRIVLKHGGDVCAEGKENEGATFYFSLPAPQEAGNGAVIISDSGRTMY